MHKTRLAAAIAVALAAPALQAQQGAEGTHRQLLEEVIVRALPFDRTSLQSAQPVQILTGEALDDARGMTLGETLQKQPGVQSSYYGPGSARPIIRGLGGPRVKILEDGLSTADASAPSDDHAISLDPMLVDQIEVLRGPAALLYGSGAVGGVVNVIDNRIPESVPDEPVAGRFEARGNSVSDERSSVLRLDGGQGNFAWHLDGSLRDAGNTRIPGRARVADDHDDQDDHDGDLDTELGPDGRLENSFVKSQSFTLGGSWIGEKSFIGASMRQFDTEYGIPAPHGHGDHGHDMEEEHHDGHDEDHDDDHDDQGADHDEEGNEFAAIDMRQRSWDVAAGWDSPFAIFKQGRLRLGYNDYEHREFDVGGEGHDDGHDDDHDDDHDDGHDDHGEGTIFEIDTFQARLELETLEFAGWSGALGASFENQDFKVEGAEAYIPNNETRSWALFALQERTLGDFLLNVGARFERTEVKLTGVLDPHDDHDDDPGHDDDHDDHTDDVFAEIGDKRTFNTWSLAAGGLWNVTDRVKAGINLNHAERAPSAAELYSNGPHLATFSFEIGDPDLNKEVTNSIDFSLHRHIAGLDLEATLFYKDIEDFVFLEGTGVERDGMPVRVTHQEDAEFYGMELQAGWEIHDTALGNFDLRAGYDRVRGEIDGGDDLPRISPDRVSLGIDWHRNSWRGNVDWYRVDDQDRIADFETPTDSYDMLNAGLAYRLESRLPSLELFLQGRNLTDERARVHTSFLKDFAPLPGRNIIVGVRGYF